MKEEENSIAKFSYDTRIEFDVNLTCKKCANSVQVAIEKLENTKIIYIDVEKQKVVIDTTLPSLIIKETIESTGKRAVLKGLGSNNQESAVSELKGNAGIFGVIRFHQVSENACRIDGTIDGMQPGKHGLHIHEYGDLSQGFNSIGPHFNPNNLKHGGRDDNERHYGDLGNIVANSEGRASFRFDDPVLKVPDIIGRSIGITECEDDFGKKDNPSSKVDGNSGNGLACAIIARSAGLFKNSKRLCQCDGVSIWDEDKVPSSDGR